MTALGLLIMLGAEVSEAVRLVLAQKLLQNLKMGVRRRPVSADMSAISDPIRRADRWPWSGGAEHTRQVGLAWVCMA